MIFLIFIYYKPNSINCILWHITALWSLQIVSCGLLQEISRSFKVIKDSATPKRFYLPFLQKKILYLEKKSNDLSTDKKKFQVTISPHKFSFLSNLQNQYNEVNPPCLAFQMPSLKFS